jgi:hypothetical protein
MTATPKSKQRGDQHRPGYWRDYCRNNPNISARFTKAEHELVTRRAKQDGVSINKLVRTLLLDYAKRGMTNG